jgi:hypothetical protein
VGSVVWTRVPAGPDRVIACSWPSSRLMWRLVRRVRRSATRMSSSASQRSRTWARMRGRRRAADGDRTCPGRGGGGAEGRSSSAEPPGTCVGTNPPPTGVVERGVDVRGCAPVLRRLAAATGYADSALAPPRRSAGGAFGSPTVSDSLEAVQHRVSEHRPAASSSSVCRHWRVSAAGMTGGPGSSTRPEPGSGLGSREL